MYFTRMTIRPGDPTPPFSTHDIVGRPVDLTALRGGPVLLTFLRNAACALCNLRVHELIERHEAHRRAGLSVIAVFESPAESMREYVGRQDAPFPLVADPEATLYSRYAVESSAAKVEATMAMPATHERVAAAAALGFELTQQEGSNFLRMPADFLIGADGTVLVAHYAQHVSDHLPLDAIDAALGLPVPA
jgi:peroxiredoxin